MLGFIKRVLGSGGQARTRSDNIVDESRVEHFYTELAFYAQPHIGDDASLEMLKALNGLCVFFRAPEGLGLPNRGRTWEVLADRDTGAPYQVVVFLDVAPLDKVVSEFFHDAWPVVERIRRKI